MNVDEKSLATEMFKKMNIPVPPPVAAVVAPKAVKKKPAKLSESETESESETSSEEEEEQKSKFQAVQRYKN
jgi:hypothetical protein